MKLTAAIVLAFCCGWGISQLHPAAAEDTSTKAKPARYTITGRKEVPKSENPTTVDNGAKEVFVYIADPSVPLGLERHGAFVVYTEKGKETSGVYLDEHNGKRAFRRKMTAKAITTFEAAADGNRPDLKKVTFSCYCFETENDDGSKTWWHFTTKELPDGAGYYGVFKGPENNYAPQMWCLARYGTDGEETKKP
jgi:hypothetical protein